MHEQTVNHRTISLDMLLTCRTPLHRHEYSIARFVTAVVLLLVDHMRTSTDVTMNISASTQDAKQLLSTCYQYINRNFFAVLPVMHFSAQPPAFSMLRPLTDNTIVFTALKHCAPHARRQLPPLPTTPIARTLTPWSLTFFHG